MTTVSFFVKIISIPDEELFSETYTVRRAHRFIHNCLNYMMFPLVLYLSPPLLRQCIAIFAVAEGWLLLDIG